MDSAQSTPRKYVHGGLVMKHPAPPTDVLSDLQLCYEIVPVTHHLQTRTVWLRMKCEGRRSTEPEVQDMLAQLALECQVEYHEQLGWRKK